MSFKLKQGDECVIPVKISVNGGALPIGDVERVEFMTGLIRRTYPEEVTYDGESGCFRLYLTQEDTFSLPEDDAVRIDVRVKFRSGCVIGARRMAVAVVGDAVSDRVI